MLLLKNLASLSALFAVLMSSSMALASSSSITKAENIAQTDVRTPSSPDVIQEQTQIPTDINSQSETVDSIKATLRDRNTNNTQSDSTNQDLPSNSAASVDKCGEQ